ncbi:hypothetical protein B296_00052595 [Ensete ventricosum]|uniref:Uncharacterized protein n=1 Tax=Ensete ventricosum TaxID=4639 RepID=A0A426WW37_ENSVE|nr:hypothetical protein B296_00052595 [Ensete ventricosum]
MAAKRLIRCFQVYGYVIPCPGSRRSGPITKCYCSGSKSLVAVARTTQDCRTTCGCNKTAIEVPPPVDFDRVGQPPGQRGISLSYNNNPIVDGKSKE